MIKTKNKEQLLDLYYKGEVENQELKIQLAEYQSLMEYIEPKETTNFFSYLKTLWDTLVKINHIYQIKYNMKELTQKEWLTAFDKINMFERREMSFVQYRHFVTKYIKSNNICNSCQNRDSAIHKSFQQFILNRSMPFWHIDPLPIMEFTSEKYNNCYFLNKFKRYTYEDLDAFILRIQKDIIYLQKHNYPHLVLELKEDVLKLKQYIIQKKQFSLLNFNTLNEFYFDDYGILNANDEPIVDYGDGDNDKPFDIECPTKEDVKREIKDANFVPKRLNAEHLYKLKNEHKVKVKDLCVYYGYSIAYIYRTIQNYELE